MGLKRKPVKRHLLEIGLNITSLIDVLTVLIFFLVKSMTVTSVVISPPADLKIPQTISETAIEDSVSVSISKNELRFNNQVVIPLQEGIVDKQFFDTDGRTIKPLKALLEKAFQDKFQLIEAAAKAAKITRQMGKDLSNIRMPAQMPTPNEDKKSADSGDPKEKMQGKIIIQADKDLPFHSIQYLLHTAAISGFVDYQFVVSPK